MEQRQSAAVPADATLVTEEQREQQRLLDHRDNDPAAPGGHLNDKRMADEAGR